MTAAILMMKKNRRNSTAGNYHDTELKQQARPKPKAVIHVQRRRATPSCEISTALLVSCFPCADAAAVTGTNHSIRESCATCNVCCLSASCHAMYVYQIIYRIKYPILSYIMLYHIIPYNIISHRTIPYHISPYRARIV